MEEYRQSEIDEKPYFTEDTWNTMTSTIDKKNIEIDELTKEVERLRKENERLEKESDIYYCPACGCTNYEEE